MAETVHRSTLAEHPDVKGVLPRFVARLPAHVRRLWELQANGDQVELQRLAHQLRGAGKSYGFAPMTELAGAVEEMILAGASEPEVARGVADLIAYLQHVEGFAAGD